MLTRLSENGNEMCARYWPTESDKMKKFKLTKEGKQKNELEVKLVSERVASNDFVVRKFVLTQTNSSQVKNLTQFHYIAWPDFGVPKSVASLLAFRKCVNKTINLFTDSNKPIVVHCSADNNARSGTYVLLDVMLDKLLTCLSNKTAKGNEFTPTATPTTTSVANVKLSLKKMRAKKVNCVQNKCQLQFVLLAMIEELQNLLNAIP